MRGKRRQLKIEAANFGSRSGGFIHILGDGANGKALKARALKIKIATHADSDNQNNDYRQSPSNNSSHSHNEFLKRLPQRDVVLRWIDAGHGIQITPQIDSYGADRRRIP